MSEGSGRAGRGWPAVRWLTARWLRRRWLAVLPLAFVVATGTTGAVLALAAAERTSNAYGDYLERENVGDAVVNPSVATGEIDRLLRSLPEVERVGASGLMAVTYDEGQPRPRGEVDDSLFDVALVYGSADGVYLDIDRPAVKSGRLPTGPNEAVITVEAAEESGMALGDVVSLAFWSLGTPDSLTPDEFAQWSEEVISPISVEDVEIVGVVTLADEVLPDDLYPREKLIVSPDLAARYDCQLELPPPGSTQAEFDAALYPDDCALLYRYYSVEMTNGAAGVRPALDTYLERVQPLNRRLIELQDEAEPDAAADGRPNIARAEMLEYFLVTSETDQLQQRVERALRPMVAALVVLGLAAAALTVTIAALLVAREIRRTQADQRPLHQLGVGAVGRAVAVGTPSLLAVAAGAAVGLVAGWLLDTGPLGAVRAVEPSPDRHLEPLAVLVALGIAVATFFVTAALALASTRHSRSIVATGASRTARRFAGPVASPAVADGLRAAYGHRAAIPVVATCALLTGTLAAAVVFGTSMSALVSTPHSYGWPWDVASITGGGYGDLDLERAHETLDNDPSVADWTAVGFLNEVTLEREPMLSMISFDQSGDTGLTLLSGSLPDAVDEVALGATTAEDHGVEVGDTVTLGGIIAERDATITGIVVFPALGPVLSGRVGTGTGLLLPEELFDTAEWQAGDHSVRDLATFVGVTLRHGADSPETSARMQDRLASLDINSAGVIPYDDPVQPPEIVEARSTLSVPTAVGLVFAVIAGLGLAFASWASVRARRRELAILRTLGFSSTHVRRSVRVQSLATMLAALAIGIPVGVVAGRAVWRAFANQLGVVPDPASPWLPMVLVAAAGVVLAVVAAQVPAHLASRASPAEGLRAE